MRGAERLEQAIRSGARSAAGAALVAFLTAGFPSREAFAGLVRAAAREADAVEIGVPFTDPMADGVTIQNASRVALEQGTHLRWIVEALAGVDPPPRAPLVLMSYLNPLLAYGLSELAADASRAGVAGMIVPDLPLEEADPLRRALEREGLALVPLATPVTPADRLAELAAASRGFLYAVTSTGTTGGEGLGVGPETTRYLDSLQAVSGVPVCAGFGVRTREHFEALAPHADGVIVGSALVEAIGRGEDPAAFLRGLRGPVAAEEEAR
jgi:tryptophan synthase alpha chain